MKYMITTSSYRSESVQRLVDALAEATGHTCRVACYGDDDRGHMHIEIQTKEPVRLEKIIDEQAHEQYMRNHLVVVSQI